MLNVYDILETIRMIQDECLDIRTITMGISLLDCIDPDIDRACEKVYEKITTRAKNLVSVGQQIETEYGIPIINKRISVTPIAMLCGACKGGDPVKFAKALQRAADACGVNFIGGYSALVQKGFSAGDLELIHSIPEALDVTTNLCSSVNIGSSKAGINMDAVALMGGIIRQSAELTADRQCVGPSKLVVLCNAPEDNPFMLVRSTGWESRTVSSTWVYPAPAWYGQPLQSIRMPASTKSLISLKRPPLRSPGWVS